MVNTTSDYTPKKGLTPEENRERKGVLNPPENIDKSTRQEFLKIQLDHTQDNLDKAIKERKLGVLLAPLINLVAQFVSLDAKGLEWLASNLWVLVVAFTLYIVEEYRKRRKMK